MRIILGTLFILVTLVIGITTPPTGPSIEAAGIQQHLENPIQPIKTISRFQEKTILQTEPIAKSVVYKNDSNLEAGTEEVLDPGQDGIQTQTLKITYYEGKEYSREITDTKIVPAKDEIISRGTKIVWRDLQTPDGNIRYWKKIRVWATHYDSHCPGCGQFTATGMRAGKGVIAVDPSVIKLGTSVYVSGYGPAIAGDTGGAVKGNMVDLGFDDAKTAGWSARFTNLYILN